MAKAGYLSVFRYVHGTQLDKHIPMPCGLVFVVAVSGVSACKTGNALEKYNRLADASHAVKVERARHESEFVVPLASLAFSSSNLQMLRAAIGISQRHAESNLMTTVPETEWLQRKALELGAIAASVFGAGFGGAVYAITRADDAETLCTTWGGAYGQAFPVASRASEFFITRPSECMTFLDGAE